MNKRYILVILSYIFIFAPLNVEAAKCISGWKLVDCKTVFGEKEYHYCAVDTMSTGEVRCYDCKSGVGGAAGKLHCGGWSVGYDFIQEKPAGGAGDDKNYREVRYGKCTEEKNHDACRF